MHQKQTSKLVVLILMCCVGIGFGIWLLFERLWLLGSLMLGLFLWRGQQFALWLAIPRTIPSQSHLAISSPAQRVLLILLSLAAAGICAAGAYIWAAWEMAQAGLVFVLFGLIVLIPVSLREVQPRRAQR